MTHRLLPQRTLGRTGLQVTMLGFGGRAIGGNAYPGHYGPTEDRWSKVAISRALGAGSTFIQTADAFGGGNSELLIGAITNCRTDTLVVTAGGRNFYEPTQIDAPDFSAEYLRFAINRSRQRLHKSTLTAYFLDNPPLDVVRTGHLFDSLDALRAEGLLRFIGLLTRDPLVAQVAIEANRIDVLGLTFNLLQREPARLAVLDMAAAHNIGVIAGEPLANGLLSGKFNGTETFPPGDLRADLSLNQFRERVEQAAAYRFLGTPARSLAQAAILYPLSHPAVATVVVGSKTREQAEENFAAGEMPPLSAPELAQIEAIKT